MTTPDSELDPQQLLNHAIGAADENDDGELQGALARLRADAIERGVLA